VALAVEGAPPTVDARAVAGFGFIGLLGTVVAYAAWFAGLRRLPAAAVSLVGLLNPVTGTVVGVTLAGETFGPSRLLGLVLVLGGALLGQPAVIEAVRRRGRVLSPGPPERSVDRGDQPSRSATSVLNRSIASPRCASESPRLTSGSTNSSKPASA
jgi:hypothetical protein